MMAGIHVPSYILYGSFGSEVRMILNLTFDLR